MDKQLNLAMEAPDSRNSENQNKKQKKNSPLTLNWNIGKSYLAVHISATSIIEFSEKITETEFTSEIETEPIKSC